ncbi:MAG: beta-ketoacyl-ACP reductase [Cyanobacteria bacterium M5B4]|nr:MAG: beta-ketoacyl-ACP reductase [Cyanobacteria bacterium M5B4]
MAWVTGFSCLTALGNTQATWHRLLRGETGIRSGVAPVEDYPSLEALLLAAVKEAIGTKVLPQNCPVVVGSSRHYQSDLEAGRWVLPARLSAVVAQFLQTQGTTIGLSCACATGNWAIIRALELLQECNTVVIACADRAVTPLSLAGFRQMGALGTECHPFSQERSGMILGEGAAAMVLEIEGKGCRVLGWGCSNDASHITTPQRSGEAIKEAIRQCLRRSQISPEQVDIICAHGTATRHNDQMEAEIIAEVFPHQPWVCASKGATGHTLGASALIEAVLCVLMLQNQVVFPVVGLATPAFNLRLPRRSELVEAKIALNLSFGFGGQNTAVCLGKTG